MEERNALRMPVMKTLTWFALIAALMNTGCGSLFSRRNSIVEVGPRKGQGLLAFDKNGESTGETELISLESLLKHEPRQGPTPPAKTTEKEKAPLGVLPPALQLISAKPADQPLQIPPVPEKVRESAPPAKSEPPPPAQIPAISQETTIDSKTPEPLPPVEPLSPLAMALEHLINNQPGKAENSLKDPMVHNQAIVTELLPLLAAVGTKDSIPAQDANRLIQATAKAQTLLRKQAELELESLQYCKQIHGFGAIEPLPSNHGFQSARGTHPGEKVQVYVEVQNVHWQKQGEEFEATLSSSLEIHDSQGKVVNMTFPARTERTKAARNDYYLSFQFRVPAKLPAGLYTLWIRVEEPSGEKSTGRTCKRSMDFRVAP